MKATHKPAGRARGGVLTPRPATHRGLRIWTAAGVAARLTPWSEWSAAYSRGRSVYGECSPLKRCTCEILKWTEDSIPDSMAESPPLCLAPAHARMLRTRHANRSCVGRRTGTFRKHHEHPAHQGWGRALSPTCGLRPPLSQPPGWLSTWMLMTDMLGDACALAQVCACVHPCVYAPHAGIPSRRRWSH